MVVLRYGNTNSYFLSGKSGGLLIDTDYAGTLPAFYKALKQHGIRTDDIGYVLATHYHPDHMGLIGQLAQQGAKLLLAECQKDFVHSSDYIFNRDKLPFVPIEEKNAIVTSCRESRDFLLSLGIHGEIISTPSHSEDSISVILDDGTCIAGDLEPPEYIDAYEDNPALKKDWEHILYYNPKRICYAHRPEQNLV